jgi:hypothetical protein
MWFQCGPSLAYECVIELKAYNLYALCRVVFFFTLQLLGAFSVFLIVRSIDLNSDPSRNIEMRQSLPGRPVRPMLPPPDHYGGGQLATRSGAGAKRLKARQILREKKALKAKIYVFLAFWSAFSILTPAVHMANVFTRNQQFPYGSLTFLFITLDFLFCERVYGMVEKVLRLGDVIPLRTRADGKRRIDSNLC